MKNSKKILFNEASQNSHPGVSKSLISCESVIPWGDVYPSDIAPDIKESLIELGVDFRNENTKNDKILTIEVAPEAIMKKIAKLRRNNPKKLIKTISYIADLEHIANYKAICEIPPLRFDKFISNEEEIHATNLLESWDEVEKFTKEKGIKLEACLAIA